MSLHIIPSTPTFPDSVLIAPPSSKPTIRDIQIAACCTFHISMNVLISEIRKRKIAHVRQMAMALSRDIVHASWPEIGRKFNRDHSTAIHAWRVTHERIKTSLMFASDLNLVRVAVAAAIDARVAQETDYRSRPLVTRIGF
jgi:chromosomal replication initiation ATPase DnaA